MHGELQRKLRTLQRDHRVVNFAASVEQVAVPGTFTYIGKGVKLGDASRIVCWYKLKETGKYRAIYGDLSVKDVQPADLPLPVAD